MKYETVWGTNIELHAIAAYLQLPIYVCTKRSRSIECYWECFKPLSTSIRPKECFVSQTRVLKHLEICHRNHCHHDAVTMSDGLLPVSPPPLLNTTLIMHLDLTWLWHYMYRLQQDCRSHYALLSAVCRIYNISVFVCVCACVSCVCFNCCVQLFNLFMRDKQTKLTNANHRKRVIKQPRVTLTKYSSSQSTRGWGKQL